MDKGEFKKGSMLPKVEACCNFVENSKDGFAVISALNEINHFTVKSCHNFNIFHCVCLKVLWHACKYSYTNKDKTGKTQNKI